MEIIRLLSYNIHKGFNSLNSRFLLKEIREAIRLVDADLIFLQEVVGENLRHQKVLGNWIPDTQFEFLADSVWEHFAYGKNAIYSHGHHGNAILSKHPFVEWDNINVSVFSKSQRGLLIGKLDTSVYVVCVHLGLFGLERQYQLRQLCNAINKYVPKDAPLIVAGDFNDWLQRADRIMWKQLGMRDAYMSCHNKRALTFPARFPILPMDRIYYRNLKVIQAQCMNGQPWSKLSDHCALYTELEV